VNVDITQRPPVRLAAVPHTGPYARINEAFKQLDPLAKAAGLVGRGASLIAVYRDDPMKTPEAQLRSAAGIMISAMTKVPPSLTEVKLEPGRYAHLTHTGPYEGLPKAWQRLWTEWLPTSGHKPAAGPSYELYRNTPATTASEELVTELYLPLA
jgi:AraC family transcriptional regulator